jgi:hypothetical protein
MRFGIASACNVDPSETPGKWFFGPKSQANARRIVACVNICAGIDTEELERHADLVSAQLATEYTLQDQRDDLLAAAREALAVIERIKPAGNGSGTQVRLAAAIEKATA